MILVAINDRAHGILFFLSIMRKIVGLVSGGKDSLFTLKVAKDLGHEIVCLANLFTGNSNESDSWIYQTVGGELVPLIAEAVNLPLVRRIIQGKAIVKDLSYYNPEADDETEDLFELLVDVKKKFPCVDTVAVGALFSDFQRLRVENVCERLNLRVVAFLWRLPQSEVLNRMQRAGLEAVLVKVASFGLNADCLGKSVSELRGLFEKLHARFGFHVAGEGGEYETLTVSCPGLMHRKLLIGKVNIIDHGGDVWYLAADQESIDNSRLGEIDQIANVDAFPDLKDLSFYEHDFPKRSSFHSNSPVQYVPVNSSDLVFSNSFDGSYDLKEIFERIPFSIDKVIFVELQLSDISKFQEINIQFAEIFKKNPPARCTVETPLPDGVQVRVRLILSEEISMFQRLHVQSISTWSMACIGPYAQAMYCKVEDKNSLCLTSGVLGLIPHSMTLPCDGWQTELWMALRSLKNIVNVCSKEEFENSVALIQVTPKVPSLVAVRDAFKSYFSHFQVLVVQVRALPRNANVEINYILNANCEAVSSLEIDDCLKSRFQQIFYDVLLSDEASILDKCGNAHYSLTPCLELLDVSNNQKCAFSALAFY